MKFLLTILGYMILFVVGALALACIIPRLSGVPLLIVTILLLPFLAVLAKKR